MAFNHAADEAGFRVVQLGYELVKLGQLHGVEAVEAEFRIAVTPPRVIKA